ncbi:hypothetical protein BFX06_14720 [Sulfobacillus thermosulfidooxidans]|nr:hypothetical protein BFX05_05875 [Sulfobacillus thermosulfidooxidans]OLZ16749.1 hypothetical protein BFX06_14720 [Sulfobacillus thermosulfidooxidans]OLZ20702.1 hypothetical protein BFX07_14560 [Sulfobacillus thermosulfidooxidans]
MRELMSDQHFTPRQGKIVPIFQQGLSIVFSWEMGWAVVFTWATRFSNSAKWHWTGRVMPMARNRFWRLVRGFKAFSLAV